MGHLNVERMYAASGAHFHTSVVISVSSVHQCQVSGVCLCYFCFPSVNGVIKHYHVYLMTDIDDETYLQMPKNHVVAAGFTTVMSFYT